MFGEKPKVLVVGAGPVGLFAALALTRRQIPAQIIDTGLWPCSHSYALALHPRSLELLREVGLLDEVLLQAYTVSGIGLYDAAGRRAKIELQGGPASGLAVVRQSILEDLLEDNMGTLGRSVSWRHELAGLSPQGDHVSATVNQYEKDSRGYVVAHTEWVVSKSKTVDVPFIIGADGHNSCVRRSLNIGFPEVGKAQFYAVFEMKTDFDMEHETRIVFGERTTDVLWPLPGGYCRWSFQLPDYTDEHADDLKNRLLAGGFGHHPTKRPKDRGLSSHWLDSAVLDEEAFWGLIKERAPWFRSRVESFNWRTIVRFERRLASTFGKDRVWLAGDAAHLTGPAGVQSMNLGMQEVNELVHAIEQTFSRHGSLRNLDNYSQHWTDTWRQLEGLNSQPVPGKDTDPWVARYADRLLQCLPAHGGDLIGLLNQLGLELKSEPASVAV